VWKALPACRGMRQWRPSTKVKERKEDGTTLGAIGHGSLQKDDSILGFLGSLAGARRTS
jgi:hypothetical protein